MFGEYSLTTYFPAMLGLDGDMECQTSVTPIIDFPATFRRRL